MGSSWGRGVAIGTCLALVAACGGGDDDDFRVTFERVDREESTSTADETEGIDLEGVPEEDQDDVIIEAALDEVASFWADRFPEVVGGVFQPVQGGFIPYGPDRDLPTCGGILRYDEIAQNAFYCPSDDLIAWDTDNLTNQLLEQFGPFTLVIVMAHEYGHAIQTRGALSPRLPTIAGEQQADCFAGAFTAFVEDGDSDVLNVSEDDLDLAVAGFLTLRDSPGTPIADPSAHGSAFDRIGAFQDGFLNGAERCAEYEDIFDRGGTTAIPLEFDARDFQTQGNAPFDPQVDGNIFDITFGSLETFWAQAMSEQFGEEWDPLFQEDQVVAFDPDDRESLPECPGIDVDIDDAAGQAFTCFGDPDDPDDDFVAFDIELAAELYEIGDFAVSGIISQQYAFVAQVALGNLGNDRNSFLQADCFSGAWAGALTAATLDAGGQELLPEFDGPIAISAGDLDEAVQSFLLLGQDTDPDEQGTTFQRVASFRDGFFNGLENCATYLEDGPPGEESGVPD
jgi:predicted metalloprotease